MSYVDSPNCWPGNCLHGYHGCLASAVIPSRPDMNMSGLVILVQYTQIHHMTDPAPHQLPILHERCVTNQDHGRALESKEQNELLERFRPGLWYVLSGT